MRERLLALTPIQKGLAITALVGINIIASYPFLDAGIDWQNCLRPATQAFLHLQSPYLTPGTFNPPWFFAMLAPLAVLPERVGGVLLFWMAIGIWFLVRWKLSRGNLIAVIAVFTSPIVVNGLLGHNVNFMVLWGLLLPPELGMFFLAINP